MARIRRVPLAILIVLLVVYYGYNVLINKWKPHGKLGSETTEVKEALTNQIPYSRLFICSGLASCPDSRKEVEGSTLRTSQVILTRMLRVLSLICKKHNITYFLYRGSLLGAARHKGHNPLDNDVDVAVLHKDFSRLKKAMQLDLPGDMFFQTSETDPYYKPPPLSNMLAKIRDRSSCYTEVTCSRMDCIQGLQIDLTVLAQEDHDRLLDWYSSSGYLWRYLIGPLKYEYQDIFPLAELEFDGYIFPVPRKWKEYLLRTYGRTYMVMPSPGLRHPLQSGSKVDNFHSCRREQPRRLDHHAKITESDNTT